MIKASTSMAPAGLSLPDVVSRPEGAGCDLRHLRAGTPDISRSRPSRPTFPATDALLRHQHGMTATASPSVVERSLEAGRLTAWLDAPRGGLPDSCFCHSVTTGL